MSASSNTNHHPTAGARVLLERQHISDDGTSATYAASIFTPTVRFDYQVNLTNSGEVTVVAQQSPTATVGPAPEHENLLATVARLTARGASKRAADGLLPWPPRILRWRGPGRGGQAE